MKIGDRVEVVAVPGSLPSGMGTQALFEACVGRVFPIVGIENGLLQLEVGEVVDEESFMHSIWIEPECVVFASLDLARCMREAASVAASFSEEFQ
jgi:hypothetical protein